MRGLPRRVQPAPAFRDGPVLRILGLKVTFGVIFKDGDCLLRLTRHWESHLHPARGPSGGGGGEMRLPLRRTGQTPPTRTPPCVQRVSLARLLQRSHPLLRVYKAASARGVDRNDLSCLNKPRASGGPPVGVCVTSSGPRGAPG